MLQNGAVVFCYLMDELTDQEKLAIRKQLSDITRVRLTLPSQHNKAKSYHDENIIRATSAEQKFSYLIGKAHSVVKFWCDQQKVHYYDLPNGKFFLIDFYIRPPFNIAFEIDGDYHYSPQQESMDKWRQSVLEKSGITVYRFGNREVLDADNLVYEKILAILGYVFPEKKKKKKRPKYNPFKSRPRIKRDKRLEKSQWY